MQLNFRVLQADEIDVRVAMVKEKFFTLLLYKDARCDMNILDETVGATGWQRQHTRDNANCIVSIWDKDKNQWISKEDTGTESNTEKKKGLASDSFKRACFNWGIGRELYTAPFIISFAKEYIKPANGKYTVTERFQVSKIKINDKHIIESLEIIDSKKNVVFSTSGKVTTTTAPKKATVSMITPAQLAVLQGLKIKTKTPLEQLTYAQAKTIIEKYGKFKKTPEEKAKEAQELKNQPKEVIKGGTK